MRKFTLLFFILFSCKLFAQTSYCNEWIAFDAGQQYSTQQYWKIKVWKDGLYRVRPSDLFAAQFPQGIDPRKIQIFYQGAEQFIHVQGEADSSFDVADYIEFYGKKNDGKFDNRLYEHPTDQGSDHKSLFTDTAVYFITINNNSTANKRMPYEFYNNYSSYIPETYFTQTAGLYGDGYVSGYTDNFGSHQSAYTTGEGFVYTFIESVGNTTLTYTFPTPNALPLPVPQAQLRMDGGNLKDHLLQIDVDGINYVNDAFIYYEVRDYSFAINNSPVGTSYDFKFTALPNPDQSKGIMYIDHVNLSYSHSFSFAGETVSRYETSAQGSVTADYTRWDIANLNFSNPVLLVYSDDTLKKIWLSGSGNTFQALIPTYGFDKKCMLLDSVANTFTNNVTINYTVSPVVASDPAAPLAKFTNFAYNPNAEYLIITHQSLWNAATAYKSYRQVNLYNQYPNTMMAESNELYDQFAYGIVKHPLSIKNFVFYALNNFSVKPKYLFLIGKSIKNYLKLIQPWTDAANLVPTFGNPPSDLMLVANKDTSGFTKPLIGVGRLSATNETDVYDYLEKIQAYESNPRDEWMKNVLHFAGGIDIDQRNEIQSKLDNYAAIVTDSAFGGYVRTLSKTVTDPIQISLSANLQNIIDSGVTLMTFYAHAGASTFDISTDDPGVWHNVDRYPMIIGNSCYVGDAHQDTRTAVENFVLQNKKGAIGFIGSAAVNFIDNLYPYTQSLYYQFSKYNYGQPIGKCMLRAIDTTYVIYPSQFYAEAVNIGMNLQGDPAIILNASEKPDLRIHNSDILFIPGTVSAALDSFTLSVTVKNIGRAINSPYAIEIRRNFPNGNFTDTIIQRPKIGYADTLKLNFPVDAAQGPGYNTYIVIVDPANTIDELTDTNNTAQQQLFILSNDITPVYPVPYAIVPVNNFTLKASTVNQFAPSTRYVFEMDTNDTYNSPMFWHDTITAAGGLITKNLPYPIDSNRVYYWRVSRDSMAGDPVHPQWNEASFIYLPTKTGWSQAHFFQFKNDDYKNIIFNRPSRKWDYVTTKSILKAQTNNKPINGVNEGEIQYYINGILQDYNGCGFAPALFVVILDPLTLQPKQTGQPDTHYGNYNDYGLCRASRPDKFFEFQTGVPAQVDSLKNLLTGKVPAGYFLLIYTWQLNQFSILDNSLKQILKGLGSDSIDSLKDGQAWILFTQVGNTTIAHEVTSSLPNENITLIDSLGGNWNRGFITSEKIGPSNKWETLHWNINNVEPLDTVLLQLWGIDTLQHEALLIDAIKPAVTDIYNLYQNIDAKFYKYLYFKMYLADDSVLPDPSQLDRWQIYFQEVPEAMVNPQLFYHISKTTPMQGDSVTVQMAIQNISNSPMDSMLVDYYIYNAQNQKINFPSKRYRKLPANDSLHCEISFSTASLAGNNVLWIEANPRNDQAEQFHFNNYAQISLKVETDITNPILDVTFDGVHILNGDIVSAKPTVEISLKDENQFLLLNDTGNFISFIYPQGQSFSRKRLHFESAPNISTNKELMQWTEATPGKNTFKIKYTPELATGIYTIEINATDRSLNESGPHAYRTDFEVDTNSTITEVINYPNPFSTSTRFVFTLTGSDLPKYFKIQIMTVTGKIIREITKEELGPLHIGRNITQYAWDGKDQFGDQLANGVYLYRVQTQLNGTSIQKRETDADKYFKHGWGKMYLMR
ncbi:MAG: C25 family cysteine peptidase [Bacteroidia bacterium]